MTGFNNGPFRITRASSEFGFDSSLGSSGLYLLETSARKFDSIANRTVLITEKASAADTYIQFGTTTTLAAASSAATLVMARTAQLFHVDAAVTAFMLKSSTDCVVNCTLGNNG